MQTQRTDLWAQQGKEKLVQIDGLALKHIHFRIKQMASGELLCNTGSSTWYSVRTQRSGMGLGVGGRLIHIVLWQKRIQHCKAIIFQLKINLKKDLTFTARFTFSVVSLECSTFFLRSVPIISPISQQCDIYAGVDLVPKTCNKILSSGRHQL